MSFIGVLTDKKSEAEFEDMLSQKQKKSNNVIMINQKNIDNIKNIRFETILINKRIARNKETTKKILQNAKNLVINADIDVGTDVLKGIESSVITYGFNQKSTVTASSIEEDEVLICVQRNIQDTNNNILEPQEIRVEKQGKVKNPYVVMGAEVINIIYGNNI